MKAVFPLGLLLLLAGCAALPFGRSKPEGPALLDLKKGDHICIVGGTIADRMQHYGYLETMIHSEFPENEIVIRNLGFAGDELTVRQRSEGFGSTDDWLKHEKADVVWAFWGYNESFKGEAGVADYKKELEKFVKETQKQDYSGKGAPRIVLFSPSAAEDHPDPNMPDPAPLNANLKLYADATREVAGACGVPFVDIFNPSLEAFEKSKGALTINAVHFNEAGYRVLAPAMFESLFAEIAPRTSGKDFEKLMGAVNDKNRMWHSRYRTIDGYNVYGGRSHLEFDSIKNRDTMQREMEQRDVMTANRDARIWAIAKGGDLEVKDDNLPPPIAVKTNKPGPNPDQTFPFLSGEDAIQHMKVPPGVKVNLFASEEQFPELVNPVQMAFDPSGRLWVAVWPHYPERRPETKTGDSLIVFDDTDNDGRADKMTTFVDDLNGPTGFQFYKDGVLLVQAPDLWFLRDTDGDGRADSKEIVLNGLDSADSHHTSNAVALEPGGAIYLSDGVFHRSQVESAWGAPVRNIDAAIFRYEPRTGKFQTHVSYGFANPHGRVFDYWGNDFVTDATGNNTYFGPAFSGHIDYPTKHSELRQFWERPSRPCPGTAILSSRHFPEEFQNEFLNLNVIGFLGCFRVDVSEEGSGLWGKTVEPALFESDDPNFRPTAIDVAPDGSIYFIDWHNPIIGHMQHHLRDPNRDKLHGRVYRMTYEGRELLKPAPIVGEPIEKLLDLLKEPENNVRTRAKIELGARDTDEVIAAVKTWSAQFSPTKIEDQHHLLEALWVHQWHNVVNVPLLKQMLHSPEPRARAQAVRVLGYWRTRVPDALALVREAINDAAPRVRLEGVRVASFFEGQPAIEAAYDVLKYEMDYYLDYVFKETTRQLQKSVEGVFIPSDATAQRALAARMSDNDLINAPSGEGILLERLERPGLNINVRTASLMELASIRKSTPIHQGIAIMKSLDGGQRSPSAAEEIGYLLASMSKSDLAKSRTELAELTKSAQKYSVRRGAFAALVAADGAPATAWIDTAVDAKLRAALIDSIALHADSDVRAQFAPLLDKTLADKEAPQEVRDSAILALPLVGNDRATKTYGVLTTNLASSRDMSVSARALMQLPRASWNAKEGAKAGAGILAWAKTVPADKRTEEDFVVTVQAGRELASLLSASESTKLIKDLNALGVPVFSLRSVREQMRFDVTRIVVEAGKPFQIIFENADMMPHNVVIVEPGAREEIGTKADGMAATPDKQGRLFIPEDKRILHATAMVEPGRTVTIKMTAPTTPGVYEYVCTYPEHWKNMFGELVIVADMDAYLKSPEARKPAPQPSTAAHGSHH